MLRYKRNSRILARVGFLTPGLALLTLFVLLPILLTAWISLHRGAMSNAYSEMQWVGLKNYQTIFHQSTFTTSLLNVILYSLANLVIVLPLAILLGMFLYQSNIRGKAVLRALLFLPYMIPTVAVAIVWGYLYAPQYGPLNQILGWFHIPPQDWLASIHEAMLSLVILNVWQTLGYYVIMVVAGLTEIPQEYYEAA
jgi:multiple sugar transport system permease protein